MTPAQIRKLQSLTSRINASNFYSLPGKTDQTFDGDFTFSVIDNGCRDIVFQASNADTVKPFETYRSFCALIGPRGGIVKVIDATNVNPYLYR